MLRDPPTVAVRAQVRELFGEHQALADETPIEETILIRNGHYCGRRFRCCGLQIVWFVEENQLKVYGREGRILQVRVALPEPELRTTYAA